MDFTKNEIENLMQMIPGGCMVYRFAEERLEIIAISERIAEGAGYTDDELFHAVGKDPFEIVYEPDRALLKQEVRECIKGKKDLNCSGRIVHKNGNFVWVHFRGRLLGNMENAPLLLSTVQDISDIGSNHDVINLIPTGMGVYIIKNGAVTESFLNDGYYRMLGTTSEERIQFRGANAIESVHPKDHHLVVSAIKQAIKGHDELRITVRMMINGEDDYLWVQMDGRVTKRVGSNCTLYVSFTDVDRIKRTSYRLAKSTMTLETSLAAGHQMCCEYDPIEKTLTGKTGKSILFGQPNFIKNFPDSLLGIGMFAPEDEPMIRENIEKVRNGEDVVQFEARILYKGKLRWFVFNFKNFYDAEKGYVVSICNFRDITLSKGALVASEHHLETVMRMNQDAVATFRMNLTRNTCESGTSTYFAIAELQKEGTVTGFFKEALKRIPDSGEQQKAAEIFSLENILEEYRRGNPQISMEHQYQLTDGHCEWFKTSLDLMENPLNNDIVGILYTQNINLDKIEKMIFQKIVQKDYIQILVYFVNRNEYYLFDNTVKKYGERHSDLWENAVKQTILQTPEEEREKLEASLSKSCVMEILKSQNEYAVSFQMQEQPRHRFQLQFSYVYRKDGILLVSTRDITDASLLEQLQYDSDHDSLTGLFNRDKTYRECDRLLQEHPEETFAFVRFDIQKFRLYNTFYGEKEGNRLLCFFADLFREMSRIYPYGVFGRSHADVFLFCFPMSEGILEWNKKFIHQRIQEYRSDFYLAGASGVYIGKGSEESAREAFNRASLASKSNMNKETNPMVLYDQKIEVELQRVHQITADMRRALNTHQFVVYLQPKYEVISKKPYGAEALVRWIHPEYGLISPVSFIPIFESNGFIAQLDRYMWEEVCILIHRWLKEGRRPGPISVNMSRVTMYSPQTVSFLTGLVKKYQIPTELLNLELTESAFVSDPEVMKDRILELQQQGFKIMMDDFGSAYSSLNTLQELPFDFLKVDKKFLDSIEKNLRSRKLLTSVVQMASALSIPVITEGVETEQQRDFVASIGSDYIQGYFYAKPMPVEDYEQNILE